MSKLTYFEIINDRLRHCQFRDHGADIVLLDLMLPGLPGTDAADALGLAITHAHAGAMLDKLGQESDLRRRQHAMLKAGRAY